MYRIRPAGKLTAAITLLALTAATLVGVTSSPAAAAFGKPVLITPADGSTVTWRYAGPFTVDLSAAPPARYHALLYCVDENQNQVVAWSLGGDTFQWDGTTDPTRTFATDPLPGTTTGCHWEVRSTTYVEGSYNNAWATFTVTPAPDPIPLTPAADAEVDNGYTGPFTADMTPALPGDYRASVWCYQDKWYYNAELATFTWDGTTNPVRTFTLTDPMPYAPRCAFSVNRTTPDGQSEVYVHRWFSVDYPPIRIRQVSQTPQEFYPLVREGYRDSTTTHFTLTRDAAVTVTVRNSAGRVVKRAGNQMAAGTRSWSWTGRDSDGRQVDPGTYRVTISARDDAGHRDTATSTAKVVTKVVDATGTRQLEGRDGARSASPGCQAARSQSRMELDCWGGRFAAARYAFSVPATTFKTSFQVAGYAPDADLCCDGRITKTSSRPSSRALAVKVQVTGWRAYTVRSVTATWKYKKRL